MYVGTYTIGMLFCIGIVFQDARENTKIGTWFDLMEKRVKEREGQALLMAA